MSGPRLGHLWLQPPASSLSAVTHRWCLQGVTHDPDGLRGLGCYSCLPRLPMKATEENTRCSVSAPDSEFREPRALGWLRVANSAEPVPPPRPTSSHWRSCVGAMRMQPFGRRGYLWGKSNHSLWTCVSKIFWPSLCLPTWLGCLKSIVGLHQRLESGSYLPRCWPVEQPGRLGQGREEVRKGGGGGSAGGQVGSREGSPICGLAVASSPMVKWTFTLKPSWCCLRGPQQQEAGWWPIWKNRTAPPPTPECPVSQHWRGREGGA